MQLLFYRGKLPVTHCFVKMDDKPFYFVVLFPVVFNGLTYRSGQVCTYHSENNTQNL